MDHHYRRDRERWTVSLSFLFFVLFHLTQHTSRRRTSSYVYGSRYHHVNFYRLFWPFLIYIHGRTVWTFFILFAHFFFMLVVHFSLYHVSWIGFCGLKISYTYSVCISQLPNEKYAVLKHFLCNNGYEIDSIVTHPFHTVLKQLLLLSFFTNRERRTSTPMRMTLIGQAKAIMKIPAFYIKSLHECFCKQICPCKVSCQSC